MGKKRILAIDGNYMAMRALGSLNMGDRVNNLETKTEQESFIAGLNNQLVSLYTTFEPHIDNIVFCTDNHSWRKDIEPYKPYHIADDKPLGYKENRKEKKEESSINYDNFYKLYREFIETLKTKIIVFDIKGLEGDDLLMFMSGKIAELSDYEMITFCTDGDLVQIVKDNVFLMRNIKSKEAPFGEYVINKKMYDKIYNQDAKSILLGNSLEANEYRQIFGLNIVGRDKVERKLDSGISIATPFKVALVKSICGDKKDNLFSVMGWKSTTGTRDYKVTDTHLEKALGYYDLHLTEDTCKQILMDKKLLTNLMITLRANCKQSHIELKEIGQHLKHNLRMNVLNRSNVPEQYAQEFDTMWEILKEEVLSKFDSEILKSLKINKTDSATNLLSESIPDIHKILIGQ